MKKKFTKLNHEIFYNEFLFQKSYTVFQKKKQNTRKTKNFTPNNKTFTPNQKKFIDISMECIYMIISEKTSIFFLMTDVETFLINRDF